MKTNILHLILVFCFLCLVPVKTVALNYTISFTGTGASSTVDSVIFQNLTKGTKVTVPAGNVLNLLDAPNAEEQVSANDETIRVYQSSVVGKSMVSFFSKQVGNTEIIVFRLDGRKVAVISSYLQAGSNTFELSLPKGAFLVQVTENEYAYTAKMLNQFGNKGKSGIVYTGNDKPASSSPQKAKSSNLDVTTMTYSAGDQLLYKGISGIYSTIVTDVPTGDKTTNFNFVLCTDADGNNYKVVTIGSQTWMAENLKTTKYNDGTAIPLIRDNTIWTYLTTPGFCWYNNDAATYGALHNWYTVNNGKLAPTGWHVSTNTEWTTLGNYLIMNGYNYDNSTSGNYYAKSLAATTNWDIDTGAGTIGNDLSKNNRTGFSALSGGGRYNDFYGCLDVGNIGNWWSSLDYDTLHAWYWHLSNKYSFLNQDYVNEFLGFSIRCVKDN